MYPCDTASLHHIRSTSHENSACAEVMYVGDTASLYHRRSTSHENSACAEAMYEVMQLCCTTRVNEDSGDRRFGGCLNAGMGLRIRITNRMVTSEQKIRTPVNSRPLASVCDKVYALPHNVQ